MLYTIQNNIIKASFLAKGAELTSLYHLQNEIEYMWNGNPEVWGKHSPVLFPIVGTLKHNRFLYHEHQYQLNRHGFARDMEFEITNQDDIAISFVLRSNPATLAVYPFEFEFYIHYSLNAEQLSVQYEVKNVGAHAMYFSVGAHPAFALPLIAGTGYEDYYLEFERKETAGRWMISPEGLIENQSVPLLENNHLLPLTKSLFYKDAIVLKSLQSGKLKLKSNKTDHGFQFHFEGFPYLGIWAAKNADFICIEPWYGIADGVESHQVLETKEGIQELEAGNTFKATWRVDLF